MKYIYAALTLSFVSCGSVESKKKEVPEKLVTGNNIVANELLNDFIKECHRTQNKVCLERLPYLLPIEFVPQTEVAAQCQFSRAIGCAVTNKVGKKFRINILIAKELAIAGEEFSMRWLINHELGHALLNRKHTKEGEDFVHALMYPYINTGFVQSDLSYVKDLKSCDTLSPYFLVKTRENPIMCQHKYLTDDKCFKDAVTQLFDDKLWDKPVVSCNAVYKK